MSEFSGRNSRDLWRAIRRTGTRKSLKKLAETASDALWAMGVKCQNLEAELDTLKEIFLQDKQREVNRLLKDLEKRVKPEEADTQTVIYDTEDACPP